MPTLAVVAAGTLSPAVPAHAEILPLKTMRDGGQLTITGYTSDIGGVDQLIDNDWNSVCRSANVNPVAVTFAFAQPQALGAMRIKFNAGDIYRWSLEGANTMADLDGGTGSYVVALPPIDVPASTTQEWREFNQTPATRKFWRVRTERLTRDDYVHVYEIELQSPEPETTIVVGGQNVRVNAITVTPNDKRLVVGQSQQYAARASLSYGPTSYDVTSLSAWSGSPAGLLTVTPAGLATAAAAGTGEVRATLGPSGGTHVVGKAGVRVRDARPLDLCVGFIHRTPEYDRFRVDFTVDQKIQPGTENNQLWPQADDVVTYRARLLNKGDVPATNVPYAWYMNGLEVARGVVPSVPAGGYVDVTRADVWPADEVQEVSIPSGAQVLHPKQTQRALHGGRGNRGHTVRFVVDPDATLAESSRINNAVEDYLGAVSFRFFMEQATYDHFNNTLNVMETYSAEDWAKMQLLGVQRRLRESGVDQPVRLTELVVVPDGALDPGGTHEPLAGIDWKSDSRWGFIWPESYVKSYAKRIENALVHELGHQMGLIDIYNYDIDKNNCQVRLNGNLVAGTSLMPLVSPWNVYYGNQSIFHQNGQAMVDTTRRGVMASPGERFFGPGDSAGMIRNRGARRGFFGDYLSAIPQGDVKLHVRNQNGTPVVADVRIFQRDYTNGTVPNAPKFTGQTDAQGSWTFPKTTSASWTQGAVAVNNPWSHWRSGQMYRGPEAAGGNSPLIAEVSFGTSPRITEYHFLEPDEVNLAMATWAGPGELGEYTFDIVTYYSRRTNRTPTISFSTSDDVYLNEGQQVSINVTSGDLDGDAVTLSMTPLDNATFTVTGPGQGRIDFAPDSLNVNRYFNGTNWDSELMSVIIKANDGRVIANRRLVFHVSDVPGLAFLKDQGPLVPCPADFSGDGFVDDTDFVSFAQAYGAFDCADPAMPAGCAADLTLDGFVDDADFVLFAAAYAQFACVP